MLHFRRRGSSNLQPVAYLQLLNFRFHCDRQQTPRQHNDGGSRTHKHTPASIFWDWGYISSRQQDVKSVWSGCLRSAACSSHRYEPTRVAVGNVKLQQCVRASHLQLWDELMTPNWKILQASSGTLLRQKAAVLSTCQIVFCVNPCVSWQKTNFSFTFIKQKEPGLGGRVCVCFQLAYSWTTDRRHHGAIMRGFLPMWRGHQVTCAEYEWRSHREPLHWFSVSVWFCGEVTNEQCLTCCG